MILGALCLVALALRGLLPFPVVFQPTYVNFQDTDAWYHMRLVDGLVSSFPARVTVDPYVKPGGDYIPIAPLVDYLVAVTSLVAGFGAPSPARVETVAAFVPPVLGVLVVVAVYWLGRHAFGPLAGLLAAAMVAVAPGPLLMRSKLGFVDHHAAEVLLSVTTVLFLLLALDARRVPSSGSRRRAWGLVGLAGVSWGAYLLTWTSGALFSGVICAWALAQFALDAAHGREAGDVGVVVCTAAAIAAAILLAGEAPTAPRLALRLVSLAGTAGALLVALSVRRAAAGRTARPALVGAVGVVAAVMVVSTAVLIVAPGLASRLTAEAGRVVPGTSGFAVLEAEPLLRGADGRGVSLGPAWDAFGPAFFIGVPALVALGRQIIGTGHPGALLVVIMTGSMLLLTLGQIRFGYYLVVGLALTSAWVCAAFIRRFRWVALLTVAVAVLGPMALLAIAEVQEDSGMPEAWHGALRWMRAATPEPFALPGMYDAPSRAGDAPQEPAYTVANWWDSGYWIVRTARRVPLAIPTQSGAAEVARFLTTTEPALGRQFLDERRARYVMLSDDLVELPRAPGVSGGQFSELTRVAGLSTSQFFDAFYKPGTAGPPAILYRAAYFNSLATRLLVFGGRARPPELIYVISWVEQRRPDGESINQLTAWRPFTDYDEARAYLSTLGPGNHDLASDDPLKPCVPVEALPEYRLAYESPDGSERATGQGSVRIFEYGPPQHP
jgi:dolichyl-diphosphooligosaccharide--protein glycosyltransferase